MRKRDQERAYATGPGGGSTGRGARRLRRAIVLTGRAEPEIRRAHTDSPVSALCDHRPGRRCGEVGDRALEHGDVLLESGQPRVVAVAAQQPSDGCAPLGERMVVVNAEALAPRAFMADGANAPLRLEDRHVVSRGEIEASQRRGLSGPRLAGLAHLPPGHTFFRATAERARLEADAVGAIRTTILQVVGLTKAVITQAAARPGALGEPDVASRAVRCPCRISAGVRDRFCLGGTGTVLHALRNT